MSGSLLYLVLSLLAGMVSTAPVLKSSWGVFQGQDGKAPGTDKPYHVYYGIPYAMPPLGQLRFANPVPFTPTDPDQVVTSDTPKSGCPQGMSFGNTEDEDCLVVNVFTPDSGGAGFDSSAPKKVIVYIHGGSFQTGDTTIYPSGSLVTDHDVIMVIVQYRLGALGFLSSGSTALPGNYGLRDQIMALQWVKENIQLFGGDADDVTLMGESAGSTSTSILSLSPMTKGLFTKVIMQSGIALAPWAIDLTYRQTFDMLANKTGCVPMNCLSECDSKMVDCMRNVDAFDLVKYIAEDAVLSQEDVLALDGYTSFAPVVDGVVIPRDPFELVKDVDYLKEIGTLDRKYMVAVDNNEALLFIVGSLMTNVVTYEELLNADSLVSKKIVKNNIQTVFPYPVTKSVIEFVSFEYFYPRDSNGMSDLQKATNIMSDIDFVVPGVEFARALVRASPSVDVYFMLFDLNPPLHDPKFPLEGSTHGIELAYFFDQTGIIGSLMAYADVYADECLPMFDLYRGVMTNMAKFGNPSLPGVVDWPKFDLKDQAYLALSQTPEVRHDLYATRVSLWSELLPKVLDIGLASGRGRGSY